MSGAKRLTELLEANQREVSRLSEECRQLVEQNFSLKSKLSAATRDGNRARALLRECSTLCMQLAHALSDVAAPKEDETP